MRMIMCECGKLYKEGGRCPGCEVMRQWLVSHTGVYITGYSVVRARNKGEVEKIFVGEIVPKLNTRKTINIFSIKEFDVEDLGARIVFDGDY